MVNAFHWIGVTVVVVAALLVLLFVVLRAYFWLIHDRFGAILFRKSQRRLSIASWHQSRLIRKGESEAEQMADWLADDWVVNERPLYLSYQLGKRRLFILAGLIDGPRFSSIRGHYPGREA